MPPNTNQASISSRTTPPTAERSIDRGTRRPRMLRHSTSDAFGSASPWPLGAIGTGFDGGSDHRTTAIRPNEAALTRNAVSMLPVARITPAIPGPTIQARLSSVAQALLAGPNSDSSRTRLGMSAPMAG